ncbi:RING-H2 finger protein [Nymphaea thermarum]|nr:RING-H2 finger protein [Nymphaea thermarum]
MASNESGTTQYADLFDHKKPVKNPLVPIAIVLSNVKLEFKPKKRDQGALLTAGVLTAGLISFRQGNSQLGQKLMRARVVAQGATVALMFGTAYYYGDKLEATLGLRDLACWFNLLYLLLSSRILRPPKPVGVSPPGRDSRKDSKGKKFELQRKEQDAVH